MPGNLEGKVAIVTGVSHDGQVGQAVAKALAAQGASLVICARSPIHGRVAPGDPGSRARRAAAIPVRRPG